MLTDHLKAVFEQAAHLDPEAQTKLAAQIETILTTAQWDADLADPANDAWLSDWIAEARSDEIVDFPRPQAAARTQGDAGA